MNKMNLQTLDHVPTQEQRRLVESTSGIGLPDDEIAVLIGVDKDTLHENYEKELELGRVKANAKIQKTIFDSAVGGDSSALNLWSKNEHKRKMGRPKGSYKSTIQRLADAPKGQILAKTENEKIKELRQLLINGAGTKVVEKAIQIALDDEHPCQSAMIKLCVDRMLPVSMFDKDKIQRSAVTINITGIGVDIDLPKVVDMEIEDVEVKP